MIAIDATTTLTEAIMTTNDVILAIGDTNDSNDKSDMIIVMICVVAFWIVICISVPIYIKLRTRKDIKLKLSYSNHQSVKHALPAHISLQQRGSSSVHRILKDVSPSSPDQEIAIENENENENAKVHATDFSAVAQPPSVGVLGIPGFVSHRPHASSEGLIRQLQ